MPLDEEGAKWSCEPCIRGHRSSKCQHFDRLMMKVPKAGRPLAKCPHPKGSCSCQKTFAFMVRIPKGSSCLCRPLYKVPADDTDASQLSSTSMSSMSSPSVGKIQKGGRKQSIIQAAPQNIAKALEAMPENLKFEEETFRFPEIPPNQSMEANVSETGTPQAAPAIEEPLQLDKGSSCCSGKSQKKVIPAPAPSVTKSCCGGKKKSPKMTTNSTMANQPPNAYQFPSWDSISHSNFSDSHSQSWQSPATSTPSAPFIPFELQNTQQNLFFSNGQTMNGLGIPPHNMGFAMDVHHTTAYPTTVFGNNAGLDCNCGDDCQCLGCAAHPFNSTTRQHVQEMGALMTFDGDDQSPDLTASASTHQNPPFPGINTQTPFDFYMQQAPAANHASRQDSLLSFSNSHSTLPSGYSSPLPADHHFNQPLMHPAEYYTIEYPVGIPSACSDITGSCQCGNDCSCVGCLTHSGHNGVALEPPVTTHPNASSEQNSFSPRISLGAVADDYASRPHTHSRSQPQPLPWGNDSMSSPIPAPLTTSMT
ncbi:hypothetical protein POX_c03624 [Penicillium oxalicum]|uniref:hypothetical protein n=1 Tax=Penicillium oxalicum TaxID=69781 RepID=UPI0020B8EDB9|nr:hypothetical protein POX_c03624 [Penicillium oxalicum]KAI2790775.1 hypothetical protein POX_c03624 [Penicillium oxalicum]